MTLQLWWRQVAYSSILHGTQYRLGWQFIYAIAHDVFTITYFCIRSAVLIKCCVTGHTVTNDLIPASVAFLTYYSHWAVVTLFGSWRTADSFTAGISTRCMTRQKVHEGQSLTDTNITPASYCLVSITLGLCPFINCVLMIHRGPAEQSRNHLRLTDTLVLVSFQPDCHRHTAGNIALVYLIPAADHFIIGYASPKCFCLKSNFYCSTPQSSIC